MLDEVLERDLYTYAIAEDGAKWRYLRKKNLDNSLTGLPRALTIIARGFIMDRGGFKSDITMDERIKIAHDTRTYLRLWCGFPDGEEKASFIDAYKDNPEISALLAQSDGWFPLYLDAIQAKNNTKEKFQNEIKRQYSEKMFNAKKEKMSGKNDLNKKCYDSIIADAFYAGPLKRQGLFRQADQKSDFSDVTFYDESDKCPKDKALIDTRKQVVACLTAHCLIVRSLYPYAGKYKYVKGELSNWLNQDANCLKDDILKKYRFNHKPLFELGQTLIGGSTCTIAIDEDWAKTFEIFELTDDDYDEKTKTVKSMITRNGKKYACVFADDKSLYLSK